MTSVPNLLVFSTVPDPTTCSSVTIGWRYYGTASPASSYPLVVTNIGVDQDRHHPREHPLAPRQDTAVVNVTLSMINPTTGTFNWTKVNVPQGRYHLVVDSLAEAVPSNIFTITNGPDVSCLLAPPSSSLSVTPTSTLSLSPSTSPSAPGDPALTSPTPVDDDSSVNKGAIAGGVVGGLAVLLLIAAIVLWVFRRRKTRTRNATPTGSVARANRQASRGLHNPSDSTGAILAFDGGNHENSPQSSTSEEDFSSEKSAVACDDTKPNLIPIAATISYPKSSAPSRRPMSMAIKPSFESHESVQSRASRPPRRSLDSSVVPQDRPIVLPSPPSPSLARYPSDRTRRASRKPVPLYDPSEFPSSESNDIPLTGRSDASLGSGARTYYLFPDVPLERRN